MAADAAARCGSFAGPGSGREAPTSGLVQNPAFRRLKPTFYRTRHVVGQGSAALKALFPMTTAGSWQTATTALTFAIILGPG